MEAFATFVREFLDRAVARCLILAHRVPELRAALWSFHDHQAAQLAAAGA